MGFTRWRMSACAASIASGAAALGLLTRCTTSGGTNAPGDGGAEAGGEAGALLSDAGSLADGTAGFDATGSDAPAFDEAGAADVMAPPETGSPSDATGPSDGGASTETGSLVDSAGSSDGGDAGCALGTLAPTSLAVRFADMILSTWPDPSTLANNTPAWEYNHGIILHGIQEVYLRTQSAKYLTYIKQYVDDYVDDAGIIDMPDAHSFDNIEPAILLPFLWQETGDAKYQLAALGMRTRFNTIPRNADLGFWHKETYPNQMWLDGIYMGEPFLSKYATAFDCDAFCDFTVVQQTTLLAKHVQDDAGLLYHAWDDTKPTPLAAWADETTGVSPSIWGRGDGWFAMSLVDTLGDMPEGTTGRSSVLAILQAMAAGLKATEDPTTGLWYEVVDQPQGSPPDWNETSGSGMFVYALKVAMDRGYIDSSYQATVSAGWQGLQAQVSGNQTSPVINNAVQGLDPQTSYAGYVNATRLSNSSQGLCAILLASSVMEATCP